MKKPAPFSSSAVRQAQVERSFYQAIVESTDDAVLLKSLDGLILSWNQGAEKLYGFTEAEAVGQLIDLIVPPEYSGELEAVYQSLREGRRVEHFETVRQRKDGSRVDVSLTVSPVADADGQVVAASAIARDVTRDRLARKALAESEASYRAIFDTSSSAIFVHDVATGAILDVNPAATALYGYTRSEMLGLSVEDISSGEPPFVQSEAQSRIKLAMAGSPQTFEWRAKDKAGTFFTVEVALRQAEINGNRRILAWVRDITERKQAEERLKLAARVFEHSIEGIVITDPAGNILSVNPGFTAITGYASEEVVGSNPRVLRSDRHGPEFYEEMWSRISSGGSWSGEVWNRRKSGEAYPEWLTISAIADADGRTTHYVSIFHDITEIKRQQEAIEHQAHHDALTGLPNRLLLGDRLEMALAHIARHGQRLAVLFLDLDNFKHINDSLGHAVGDMVLQELAKRLRKVLRAVDTISRQGGDEFIALIPEIEASEYAAVAAQRILDCLRQPFRPQGHELYATASIGIAVAPDDGAAPGDLIKNADLAMYRAKELGRNNYQFFAQGMDTRAHHRLSMESRLRKALERDEFELHYQPVIELADGAIVGAEALVRWRDGDILVAPGEFIPLAEETGLILPLGAWVLQTACAQARVWRDLGYDRLAMAVNISSRQFSQPDFVELVSSTLEATGFPAGSLLLEITESVLVANIEIAAGHLQRLKDMGVKIMLDDFGTGYSSLCYLKRMPIDGLKIDRSFVMDIHSSTDSKAIAGAVISLARALELGVVAEGVETIEQLDYLRQHFQGHIQGFYASPPVTATSFEKLLATRFLIQPELALEPTRLP